APFLISPGWEPLSPMLRYGVFASRWPLGQETVWTVVNRNDYDVEGPQIDMVPDEGLRYYDLYHGVELTPVKNPAGRMVLSFNLEAHGYGALLASRSAPGASIQTLMTKMKELTSKPLASYSHEWKLVAQQMVPIASTKPPASSPTDMVKIPESVYKFHVEGIEIDGFNDIGVDVQKPWEATPRRFHDHPMQIK